MRIGVIATLKRGMEHFVYRELTFFAAAGLAISVFPTKFRPGLYNPPPEWRLHRWNALVVVLLQPYFALRAPLRYLRLLKEAFSIGALADFVLACYFSLYMADVDVIYATFGDHKLFVGYFCKRLLQKPMVVTIHAYELYQNPNPELFVRALACCDQIITVTEHNREYLLRHYGIDSAAVEVVRCSVDTQEYRPERKFVVLIVGFFVERKGHEILFRAIKRLEQDDIEIWVVGDEGAEDKTVDVPAMARRLAVDPQVAFFGKLSGNALKAVYRSCDVFCLPCRTDSNGVAEGFPVALIEAMAFGKPIITTRHVEIPRIIKEILVDENDVQGLADAIRQVYWSASLRDQLGMNNRRIAEQVFSPSNAARSAALLRRVVDRNEGKEADQPVVAHQDRDAQDVARG
jgi:colanic acid/amylovoran biosynthesis glycosyltransferase